MILDEWNGSFGRLPVDRNLAHLLFTRLRVNDGFGFHPSIGKIDLVSYHHIIVKIERSGNYETKHYLTHDLEPACQSLFVLEENLDIVVNKSDHPQPYGRDDHQDDVNIVQLGKKQYGDENGHQDNDATHSGSALFLHLTFKSEITDLLPYLLPLQHSDHSFTPDRGDEQSKDHRHGRTEGDVFEHPGSRDIKIFKVSEEIVKHFDQFMVDALNISLTISRSSK